MANAGITRFTITDAINGAGAWRFKESRQRQPAAAELYHRIFAALGMPLAPGTTEVRCTKQEFDAGYDYQLGIDAILTFANSGRSATLQEKFLLTSWSTLTVEYMQDHVTKEQGDWFRLKAQYYFVGYDEDKDNLFERWVLVNWSGLMDATDRGEVPWQDQVNQKDNARASFRYINFWDIPRSCIVAAHYSHFGDVWIPSALKAEFNPPSALKDEPRLPLESQLGFGF